MELGLELAAIVTSRANLAGQDALLLKGLESSTFLVETLNSVLDASSIVVASILLLNQTLALVALLTAGASDNEPVVEVTKSLALDVAAVLNRATNESGGARIKGADKVAAGATLLLTDRALAELAILTSNIEGRAVLVAAILTLPVVVTTVSIRVTAVAEVLRVQAADITVGGGVAVETLAVGLELDHAVARIGAAAVTTVVGVAAVEVTSVGVALSNISRGEGGVGRGGALHGDNVVLDLLHNANILVTASITIGIGGAVEVQLTPVAAAGTLNETLGAAGKAVLLLDVAVSIVSGLAASITINASGAVADSATKDTAGTAKLASRARLLVQADTSLGKRSRDLVGKTLLVATELAVEGRAARLTLITLGTGVDVTDNGTAATTKLGATALAKSSALVLAKGLGGTGTASVTHGAILALINRLNKLVAAVILALAETEVLLVANDGGSGGVGASLVVLVGGSRAVAVLVNKAAALATLRAPGAVEETDVLLGLKDKLLVGGTACVARGTLLALVVGSDVVAAGVADLVLGAGTETLHAAELGKLGAEGSTALLVISRTVLDGSLELTASVTLVTQGAGSDLAVERVDARAALLADLALLVLANVLAHLLGNVSTAGRAGGILGALVKLVDESTASGTNASIHLAVELAGLVSSELGASKSTALLGIFLLMLALLEGSNEITAGLATGTLTATSETLGLLVLTELLFSLGLASGSKIGLRLDSAAVDLTDKVAAILASRALLALGETETSLLGDDGSTVVGLALIVVVLACTVSGADLAAGGTNLGGRATHQGTLLALGTDSSAGALSASSIVSRAGLESADNSAARLATRTLGALADAGVTAEDLELLASSLAALNAGLIGRALAVLEADGAALRSSGATASEKLGKTDLGSNALVVRLAASNATRTLRALVTHLATELTANTTLGTAGADLVALLLLGTLLLNLGLHHLDCLLVLLLAAGISGVAAAEGMGSLAALAANTARRAVERKETKVLLEGLASISLALGNGVGVTLSAEVDSLVSNTAETAALATLVAIAGALIIRKLLLVSSESLTGALTAGLTVGAFGAESDVLAETAADATLVALAATGELDNIAVADQSGDSIGTALLARLVLGAVVVGLEKAAAGFTFLTLLAFRREDLKVSVDLLNLVLVRLTAGLTLGVTGALGTHLGNEVTAGLTVGTGGALVHGVAGSAKLLTVDLAASLTFLTRAAEVVELDELAARITTATTRALEELSTLEILQLAANNLTALDTSIALLTLLELANELAARETLLTTTALHQGAEMSTSLFIFLKLDGIKILLNTLHDRVKRSVGSVQELCSTSHDALGALPADSISVRDFRIDPRLEQDGIHILQW